MFSGQGGGNSFGVDGWELTLLQQFQFGDLRVETSAATIVVEVESGGGVDNLVKYWPLLACGVSKIVSTARDGAICRRN